MQMKCTYKRKTRFNVYNKPVKTLVKRNVLLICNIRHIYKNHGFINIFMGKSTFENFTDGY